MKRLESQIIADMTSKTAFRKLLKSYGFQSLRLAKREKHVEEGGLNRLRGRLDLFYTTEVGSIIVEAQRGKSNNDHYERFAGYLSNFADGECIGLIWVAEEFTDMHIYMCQTSDNPILPVEAKWNGKRFEYTPMLDMVECFGSYDMAYVSYTISANKRPERFTEYSHPVNNIQQAFIKRNHMAGHLINLLSSKTVYPSGLTPFEIQYPTSGITVSAATLQRLHNVLS